MRNIIERLRAEIDPDVNEPLDRLLEEAADKIEALYAEGQNNSVMWIELERERCAKIAEQMNHTFGAEICAIDEIIAERAAHQMRDAIAAAIRNGRMA